MSVRENFADIYLRGMRDRSMPSGTELAREIYLTDWSTAVNLSNQSSGVQIPRDICTRFGRYLYSTKCSWIIMCVIRQNINTWIPFPSKYVLMAMFENVMFSELRTWKSEKELFKNLCCRFDFSSGYHFQISVKSS